MPHNTQTLIVLFIALSTSWALGCLTILALAMMDLAKASLRSADALSTLANSSKVLVGITVEEVTNPTENIFQSRISKN